MFKEIMKTFNSKEGNNKKKIENLIFLVIILILLIIFINIILKDESNSMKEEKSIESIKDTSKTLAEVTNAYSEISLDEKLEKILSTIKGVGDVNVFINYSESSKTVAMYDEKTTVSSTEENDSKGGIRNTTSTETQKDVIYSDSSGSKMPVTEKIVMPSIEGAIVTARGASNTEVKSNIIGAVQAATGLSIDKIQVYEMK